MSGLDLLPSEVPGYAEAQAAGRGTVITAEPPKVLPGRSARQLLQLGGAAGGALFLGVAVSTTALGDRAALPVMVTALAGFGVVVALLLRMKSRLYDELLHGYTSVCLQMGRAHAGRWRQQTTGGGNLLWDYAGTWFLRQDGSVRRPPQPDAPEAPGFYPSPTGRGRLELWTGVSWAGLFQN
ncbi:hypothetical protein ACWGJ9_10900 [Curtobacterium citreum]